MSAIRRRPGRVKVSFGWLEKYAATVLPNIKLAQARDDWTLSPKSSLYRRKDGMLTVRLKWVCRDGWMLQAFIHLGAEGQCLSAYSNIRLVLTS